ncbi:ribonuclease III [Symbiobacterium thermophilum]|uniref:Ribonuclease 3 n=1 Tax=Symbiobacterium thermophilum TaxID=2734 RepID=A0A953I9R2_SYMTR|nr:ribonuclease III [Symbiobacterium thermophilum]MBY6276221.1 ribonuclease III [Symbiobacterium thermophilum]
MAVSVLDPGRRAWCAEALGYEFRDESLLLEALTHTTYANEHPRARANERLEFLGDSVLGMVIAAHLYERYPDLPEGELTKIRAAVVCEPSLAERARALGIGRHMRFGRGEAVSGRDRDSTLSDAFEAVVGALYLDGGLEAAQRFVLRELGQLVEAARQGLVRVDYKTQLQEQLQRQGAAAPQYRLLVEEGPAHLRRFQVGVYFEGRLLGTGWGRNKKEAEQEAARQALMPEHHSG